MATSYLNKCITSWFSCHDDDAHEEDDDDETPVDLHSGKLRILNRVQLAAKMEETREILLELYIGSIRGNWNVVLESIRDVGFKVVINANKIE